MLLKLHPGERHAGDLCCSAGRRKSLNATVGDAAEEPSGVDALSGCNTPRKSKWASSQSRAVPVGAPPGILPAPAYLFSKLFPWPHLTLALGLSCSLLSSFSPEESQSCAEAEGTGLICATGSHIRAQPCFASSPWEPPELQSCSRWNWDNYSPPFPSRRGAGKQINAIYSLLVPAAPASGACSGDGGFFSTWRFPHHPCWSSRKRVFPASQTMTNGKAPWPSKAKGKDGKKWLFWSRSCPAAESFMCGARER